MTNTKLKELKIFEKVAFEFKDGWIDLVYNLGKDITELCELTNCELPYIQQIKEKMGTLKFYYNCLNSPYPEIVEKSIRALVQQAENKSANICEVCGKYGELRTNGIFHTSCENHKLENSMTAEEWKDLNKKQREDLETKQIEKKPYKPLKLEDIKSPILKRKIMEKVACFEAVCFDYEIKAIDVYNILRTKDDTNFSISYDVIRKKVLKYISVDNLRNVFNQEQLIEIFSDVNLRTIKNPDTKTFLKDLKDSK